MRHTTALGNLVVLDATDGVAGQYCGRLLSDFGASVTLLEPVGGTPTRRVGPFDRQGESFLFQHLNLGKEPGSRDALAQLATSADIALVGPDEDAAKLRETNPRLITCTISDFGTDGPRKDWKGGELIQQALSGVMFRNGDPKRHPLYGCGHRSYYVSGAAAYSSVLAAIFARSKSGKGQHCSIDVAECAASMTYAFATQYNYNRVLERRTTPANLPSAVLQCSDGWISVFVYAYRWKETCEALNVPDLANNPVYATAEGRMENWPQIVARIQESVRDLPAELVVDRLQSLGSVAGKAARPSQMASNPHLVARDYWEVVETPDGPRTVLGPPFRMEKTPRVLPAARRKAS